MARRILLLGDSTLDNQPYVGKEPDTTRHLQTILGDEWQVSRLALDGAVMDDIQGQLDRIRESADVIVLSVGGNDAIGYVHLLQSRKVDSRAYLASLKDMSETFADRYASVVAAVRPLAERLITCTIYEVPLGDAETAGLARAPLSMLNDRIFRASARAGADILDLRTVCTEPSDFVMQIEPSAQGARKIAEALARSVMNDGLAAARILDVALLDLQLDPSPEV